MLGGGFLRQMNETLKYNRQLLGKEKRKPFEKPLYTEGDGTIKLKDSKTMSAQEKNEFIQQLKIEAVKERRRMIRVLIVSAIAALVFIYVFVSFLSDYIIDFIR